jgi:hypothetical protein
MAIDQFDSEGEATLEPGSRRLPDGRQVEVRLMEGYDCAYSSLRVKEELDFCPSNCMVSEGSPNVFVSQGCYHAWLDWAALPRLPPQKQAFPSVPTPLPFGAELYEIINSEEGLRGECLKFF